MVHEIFHQQIGGSQLPPVYTHSFRLDEKVDWLSFQVSLSRKCWFGFYVWDPDGVLRVQYLYGQAPPIILLHREPEKSSGLTLSGDLPLGEWKIEVTGVDTPLSEGSHHPIEYRIEMKGGRGEPEGRHSILPQGSQVWATKEKQKNGFELFDYPWEREIERNERWYKGDFHTHTRFSDGKMSPREGMDQALKMGLDFFVATDHHVVPTGWIEDKVLVIPGIEVTSTKGHFNALGIRKWLDYRITSPDGGMEKEEGMMRLLRETREFGGLTSLNHPRLEPWHWQFRDTPLKLIDTIEIWNDPTYPFNPQATEEALKLWNLLWNEGYRIWGIGGSDSHLRPDESYTEGGEPSLIGDPGTYVFAEGLSASKILDAVSKGRVYVSRGPLMDVFVQVGEKIFPLGSDITEGLNRSEQGRFTYAVQLSYSDYPIILRWIVNGEEVFHQAVTGDGLYRQSFEWGERGYDWMRVEVRDEGGSLLAFTNPIYHGERKPQIFTWGELLERAR